MPPKKSPGRLRNIEKIAGDIRHYLKETSPKEFKSRITKAINLCKYAEKNLYRLKGNNLDSIYDLIDDLNSILEMLDVSSYDKIHDIWKKYYISKGKTLHDKIWAKIQEENEIEKLNRQLESAIV